MRILNVTSALAIALLTAAISEQANAVIVVYTLTFTGKSGDRANGTGRRSWMNQCPSIPLAKSLTETGAYRQHGRSHV